MNNQAIAVLLQNSTAVIERMQAALHELQPYAEFGMAVMEDERSFSMNDAAKSLHDAVKRETGFDMGQKKMFSALRDMGILSNYGSNYNEPYQQYINSGFFRVTKHETEVGIKSVTRITGKGMAWVLPKLLEYYRG